MAKLLVQVTGDDPGHGHQSQLDQSIEEANEVSKKIVGLPVRYGDHFEKNGEGAGTILDAKNIDGKVYAILGLDIKNTSGYNAIKGVKSGNCIGTSLLTKSTLDRDGDVLAKDIVDLTLVPKPAYPGASVLAYFNNGNLYSLDRSHAKAQAVLRDPINMDKNIGRYNVYEQKDENHNLDQYPTTKTKARTRKERKPDLGPVKITSSAHRLKTADTNPLSISVNMQNKENDDKSTYRSDNMSMQEDTISKKEHNLPNFRTDSHNTGANQEGVAKTYPADNNDMSNKTAAPAGLEKPGDNTNTTNKRKASEISSNSEETKIIQAIQKLDVESLVSLDIPEKIKLTELARRARIMEKSMDPMKEKKDAITKYYKEKNLNDKSVINDYCKNGYSNPGCDETIKDVYNLVTAASARETGLEKENSLLKKQLEDIKENYKETQQKLESYKAKRQKLKKEVDRYNALNIRQDTEKMLWNLATPETQQHVNPYRSSHSKYQSMDFTPSGQSSNIYDYRINNNTGASYDTSNNDPIKNINRTEYPYSSGIPLSLQEKYNEASRTFN